MFCHMHAAHFFIYRTAPKTDTYTYHIKFVVSCVAAFVCFLISGFDFEAPFCKFVCFARFRCVATVLHMP